MKINVGEIELRLKSHLLPKNPTANIVYPEVEVLMRLVDICHKNSYTEIDKESSKLRTYGTVKKEAGEEPYPRFVKNVNSKIGFQRVSFDFQITD